MIYNKEFTDRLKREFRIMSIQNPPAIDPRALGMTNNILTKQHNNICTSTVICMGIITHQFINYCYEEKLCNNYVEVDRILTKAVILCT